MPFIKGEDRHQEYLLPGRIEDYVAAESPVRVIDAFVDQLDLKILGFEVEAAGTGRPGYHPAALLKLYAYGYLQRIRSSRRLEAECHRNLEVMWLMGNLRPDHWTIAAFRREHCQRFKAVLREFNLTCRKLGLFGAELVAIDGAKFKAVNSRARHVRVERLPELIAQIDAQIVKYVEQLDQSDEATAGVPEALSRKQLQEKLERLRQMRVEREHVMEEALASGASEASLTDPDSRGQKKVGVGYNVQVAVDAKNHMIAAESVEQAANDVSQLEPMAKAAKESIGAKTIVADAGYHERRQLAACEEAKLETYIPAPANMSGRTAQGEAVHRKQDFSFDEQQDAYRCPGGHWLTRTGHGTKHGKACTYYTNKAACASCVQRAACTTAGYRKLSRLEHEAAVERQAARVAQRPDLVARRKAIVEHVFGTMRQWGHDQFLCRGLPMVRAEFSLTALTYNLRRALNVTGPANLLSALRAA